MTCELLHWTSYYKHGLSQIGKKPFEKNYSYLGFPLRTEDEEKLASLLHHHNHLNPAL